MLRFLFGLLTILFLCGCAGADINEPHPYRDYLNQKKLNPRPAPDDFDSCRAYGCAKVDRVSLNRSEWRDATAPLRRTTNAVQERDAIAKYVGAMERVAGAKTGTSADIAGTYDTLGPYQLDCVDESTNTTVYLAMAEDAGLLKFHKVMRPTARIPIIGGGLGPHQTAAIAELKTATRYAVDSWFHDNGHPAEIAPMGDWKTGWEPPEGGNSKS